MLFDTPLGIMHWEDVPFELEARLRKMGAECLGAACCRTFINRPDLNILIVISMVINVRFRCALRLCFSRTRFMVRGEVLIVVAVDPTCDQVALSAHNARKQEGSKCDKIFVCVEQQHLCALVTCVKILELWLFASRVTPEMVKQPDTSRHFHEEQLLQSYTFTMVLSHPVGNLSIYNLLN